MLSAFLVLLLAGASGAATPDWPSWGGPNGNFVVDGKGLPRTFADSPPKQVWQRSLGDSRSVRLTVLDRIMVASVLVAVIAMAVWFFAFAGSSLLT